MESPFTEYQDSCNRAYAETHKIEKKYKKLKKKYKKLKKFAKEFYEIGDFLKKKDYCSFNGNAEDLYRKYKKVLKKL